MAGPGPASAQVGLVAVNVARPAPLGLHRGRPVISAIAKRPVTGPGRMLRLTSLNLEGDAQADLRVHGGPDKAVYAYPAEHLAAWAADLQVERPLGPAAFGENLTTTGWLETDVCIGDRWAWGDALLEVAQPRSPCFKLAIHRGRGDIGRMLRESGRTGWYLRVLVEGTVPVDGPIEVVLRHPMGATVRLMHEAASPSGSVPAEVLDALMAVEPLAEEWRTVLAARRR